MSAAILALLLAGSASAGTAERSAVAEDMALILQSASLAPDALAFTRSSAKASSVAFRCTAGTVTLAVAAPDEEWGPAFYHGLHTLGFSWPHPRRQLSPAAHDLRRLCGKTVPWKPRLALRGFHLHTQHPSEFVAGFVEGNGTIAEDVVRWSARNRQNLLQVKALYTRDPALMAPYFALARRLGLTTGLDVSLSSIQQRGHRLLGTVASLIGSAFPGFAARRIERAVHALCDAVPFDHLSVELGSSEFTPTPKAATLAWLDAARRAAASRGRSIFTKVHVSSGQGDFNFLAREAHPDVGVQVHTVMPFALEGPAPVYGRDDFADLKDFMLEQRGKRPVWFFPETSYFVGIDIDVPLLLTDYLVNRSHDMDLLERERIPGQVMFTTGQELGYWLMDWNAALLADGEEKGGPLAALRRLGEDEAFWRRELAFQSRFFLEQGALSMLSASSLLDELPFLGKNHRLLRRRLLRELEDDPAGLAAETAVLEAAAAAMPDPAGVRDAELRAVLGATHARVRHALALRRALSHPLKSASRAAFVAEAAAEREMVRPTLAAVAAAARYPEARVFDRREDATSYDYGYGWPAVTLFFWEREERIVAEGRKNPFFRQIYKPLALLF